MIRFIERHRGTTSRSHRVIGGAALALAAVVPARAWAGVEYVTTTTNCANHVTGTGNGLTVMAGTVSFEVWGNSIDLTPASGFKFTGPPGMTATLGAQRSGATNNSRGCGFVGSAIVTVTSAGNLAGNAAASVSFRMPLGDFSTLNFTIVPQPPLAQATWTQNGSLSPGNMPCIIKTGSITTLNQDTKLVIQLPPGSAQDQTTCTSNDIDVRLHAASGSADVVPTITYNVTGLPPFLSVSQTPAPASPLAAPLLSFKFNVSATRTLAAASNSTITIANPLSPTRTTTLTLQVTPTPGQGFAQVATANPSSTTAGNPIDFTLKLSAPVTAGQIFTWRMTQAACFRTAVAEAPYNSAVPFQHFRVTAGGLTSVVIRVQSQNAAGCTDRRTAITHIFEAWIGNSDTDPQITAVTSGPTYTKTNIALIAP